ncbi:MAG: hypothetical protein JXR94_05735 [Candidatus Hydrogenedentes bacterium]|nr:hypothetical protein [Candidatus Hydrogenedentota bacterium]
MPDREYTIQIPLFSKRGIAILAVVIALAAWNIYVVQKEAPEAVIEPLRHALAAEYGRAALPGIQASLAENDQAGVTEQVDELLANMDGIEVSDVSARGTGDEICIRATIRVNGGPPPDGRTVRYFLFSRSTLVGWMYQRDASAFEYYLTFF